MEEEKELVGQTEQEENNVKIPEGYYMGKNGVLYPIGTPQYGIATHIAPNTTINGKAKAKKEKNAKKTGTFITAIVMTILGIATSIYTAFCFSGFLTGINAENAGVAILLVILFITVGCIFYIPALALSGAGLGFSISSIKSTSKAIKGFGIFFTIINAICLLALLVIFGWLMIYPLLV